MTPSSWRRPGSIRGKADVTHDGVMWIPAGAGMTGAGGMTNDRMTGGWV
ncbi:MAG: hypothetical protein K2Y07_12980 [Nitrosomonas sp.]|nr:hypothetical protein [Nitrosomonas sp.]